MPHFPSLNIRTGGIHIILAAYKNLFRKTNNNLTNGKTIFWHNVKKLVEYLAEAEYQNLVKEYNLRAKWSRRNYPSETLDEKMNKLDKLVLLIYLRI